MAKSPKKSTSHVNTKGAKAPGKTILPRNKFQQQRRFSLIDSDSSSSLSEFESENDDDEEEEEEASRKKDNHPFQGNKFHAIESNSEEEEEESEDSESTNEEIWKSHAKKVVNTSSTSSEGENDDSDSDSDSSSSDDEDVDFVKLTAERKARSLEQFRSNSPFKSPSPTKKKQEKDQDIDFSFNFNNDDHRIRITNDEEEEDVGEELSGVVSPLNKNNSQIASIPGGDALPYPNIQDSSESDDDIDKDELLRTLEQESDGIDGGFGTNDDEYNLLREEADNIQNEYDGGELFSSNNATPRNSVVEDIINKHKAELNQEKVLQFVSDDEYADDDDDDYDDDDEYNEDFIVPFFDDSEFRNQLYTNGNVIANNNNNHNRKQKELDSDDDSYLWDYFFSSGEENEKDHEDNSNHFSDDEATDEDTTLPPPSSRRKIGAKAQELLSSSSVTARPPALGTWSTDSKPFGIIDGLSTRSLLPGQNRSNSTAPSSSSISSNHQQLQHHKNTPNTPISSNANNIEELTLDELLNMSELEDDNDDEPLNHQDWLEVTGSNRKVPLSAFRNKGIVNDNSHINATRRFSSSNPGSGSKKLNKKLGKKINEITMTPVRTVNKSGKDKRRNSKLRRRQSMAEAAVEGLRVTKSGLFSEDTLTNVEEFLSGLGSEAELSVLFREIQ